MDRNPTEVPTPDGVALPLDASAQEKGMNEIFSVAELFVVRSLALILLVIASVRMIRDHIKR